MRGDGRMDPMMCCEVQVPWLSPYGPGGRTTGPGWQGKHHWHTTQVVRIKVLPASAWAQSCAVRLTWEASPVDWGLKEAKPGCGAASCWGKTGAEPGRLGRSRSTNSALRADRCGSSVNQQALAVAQPAALQVEQTSQPSSLQQYCTILVDTTHSTVGGGEALGLVDARGWAWTVQGGR